MATVSKRHETWRSKYKVVGSALLGSPDSIAFIKDKFLSGKKTDKDLTALKELVEKAYMQIIFEEVESVFGEESALGRNVKMFLCQRNTGEKLKDIGTQPADASISLSSGWNLIGLKSDQGKGITDLISGNEDKIASIWKW